MPATGVIDSSRMWEGRSWAPAATDPLRHLPGEVPRRVLVGSRGKPVDRSHEPDRFVAIPVRREKVRLELVSADEVLDGGADDWGADEPDEAAQLELVLHREEPEIRLRPVPVERVRLARHLVTERRTVSEWLRKEQVEVDQA